ncbi:uncharacterized protein TRIREDRAFT_104463 [Trichoderma reesei QM6a]|uniref:non-specific serine/threonine protein kinase n=1 Tax=Hypocrea jecorina (strain QM6a) TaxID=431241 RepID=G0RCG5_HYPJQ|nr:uncharacterized protein TRIREDRAFT_104463 [Trichoderma reesei QM6a]EGR51502.1 predicted protein [Trichoderma reesei QM6a]
MDEATIKIIGENPIGNGLNAFRNEFASVCDSTGLASLPDAFDRLEQSRHRSIAFDLHMTLARLRAAQLLPNGDRSLLEELFRYVLIVNSDDFDLSRIKPLLKAILVNSDDVAVWTQVYNVFSEATPLPPLTPPSISSVPRRATTPMAATTAVTPTRVTVAASDTVATSAATSTPSVPGIPWTRNTTSILNSSEHCREIDPILKRELGNPRVGIRRFRESFFARVPNLETAAAAVFDKCCRGEEPLFGPDGWAAWPADAKEAEVLAWFGNMITKLEELAADYRPANMANRRKLLAQPKTPLIGSTGRRSMDIGFVNDDFVFRPAMGRAGRYRWSHILVPGELKSNPAADAPPLAWIDLATYAREVLSAQDNRRFVLALTLCGSNLRLWEYDRLGGMASEQFNINESRGGLEFVATMLGFLWMDEEGLGFDPSIMESQGKRFIEIERDGKPERLIIDEVITRPRCIASRATTCWKAHREDDPLKAPLVIKDSWQYPERDEEGLLVKEATEKGVINMARYYHHETVRIGGVEDEVRILIRKGLDSTTVIANTAPTTTGTKATAETAATENMTTTPEMTTAPAGFKIADTAAVTFTSAMSAITATARRRSTSSSASSTATVAAAAGSSGRRRGHSVASQSRKATRVMQLRESSSRSSNSIQCGGNNDNRPNNGSSSSVAGTKRRQSEANLDNNDDDDDDDHGHNGAADARGRVKRSRSESAGSGGATPLTNRVHRRVVLQDYGKPIYTASSPTALLAALESCIRGHESLRRQAGLLHRDISINNVVIDEDGPGDRKGFLIDLDLAIKEQRIKASGTKGKTGTRAFMAIGVLMGRQHSFMHDLESFFWVLFWICVHYDGPDKARKSDFDEWNFMRDRNLAGAKLAIIYDFESFRDEAESSFTPFYAPLIPLMDRLRAVVFPNGQPQRQPDEGLYSAMSNVLLQGLE